MLARLLLLACAFVALAVVPAATAGPQPHLFVALIDDINRLGIDDPNANPQPFLASAEASARAAARGNDCATLGALGALENKLDAQGIDNPNIHSDIAAIEREVPPGPC
jgi:hypothetical protein